MISGLYEGAVLPVILCGAEIWGEDIVGVKWIKLLSSVERRAITSAYRTAPPSALCIISGYCPLKILGKGGL